MDGVRRTDLMLSSSSPPSLSSISVSDRCFLPSLLPSQMSFRSISFVIVGSLAVVSNFAKKFPRHFKNVWKHSCNDLLLLLLLLQLSMLFFLSLPVPHFSCLSFNSQHCLSMIGRQFYSHFIRTYN